MDNAVGRSAECRICGMARHCYFPKYTPPFQVSKMFPAAKATERSRDLSSAKSYEMHVIFNQMHESSFNSSIN
jgi:hypothetical protein